MSPSDRTPRDVQLPPSRDRIGRAIDEELRLHLEERARDLQVCGLSFADAWAQARREFGDLDAARVELRRIDELAAHRSWLVELWQELGTDLGRTLRGIARRPAFAAVVIITLGLGIGANAVMFGLVDRLLFAPPAHVADPESIRPLRYEIANFGGGRIPLVRTPYAGYEAIARENSVFSGVAGYADARVTLVLDDAAEELRAAAVTPGYFPLLGPRPALGRFFGGRELAAGDDHAVVISHELWRRRFGERPDVLGRALSIAGESFTVVGVAPRNFTGEFTEPFDVWLPLVPTTPIFPRGWDTNPRARLVWVVARLRDGVSDARAMQEATQRYRAALAGTPAHDSTALVKFWTLEPGRDGTASPLRPEGRVALWLQGVSLLVLVIAIANATTLLLLRAIERRRETAVRLALGISRTRLVRHAALEGLVLAVTGGAVAVALSWNVGPALWRLVLPEGVDFAATASRIACAAALVAVFAAVVLTVVPSMVQLRVGGSETLREGSRGSTRRSSALGEALVVVQVALTVVLLVGAGLFTRSMHRVSTLDFGFTPERVLGVRLAPGRPSDSTVRAATHARVADAVRAVPGVQLVATAQTAPFRPVPRVPMFLPGREELPGVGTDGMAHPAFEAVSPEYFEVMGIPIVRGRAFTTADGAGAGRVMIVDESIARAFWPGEDPIGRCVQLVADTMPCTTVVGVARDRRRFVAQQRHSPYYFLPLEQTLSGGAERYVFARGARDPLRLAAPVAGAASSVASTIPVAEVTPILRGLDWELRPWRLGMSVFVAFGVLATVVAAIGLYGVVSFDVARRARELGIRRALGASTQGLVRVILTGAARPATVGILIGSGLSLVLWVRVRELLFHPTTSDLLALGAAAATILAATVVASIGPGTRVIRADPMDALRSE